jgi:nitroreductase
MMELFEALYTRMSIGKVKPDPVPRELIEKILEAAAQAPNHHKVQPWRFIVITGAARRRLGEVMAQSLIKHQPEAPPEVIATERAKPLRAPVLIAVGVDRPSGPKVVEMENICAAAAATENMLLAAHGLGLAAQWRTGPAATDPDVKALLGLEADQHLIAFVYVGWCMVEPQGYGRPPAAEHTTWIEE